MGCIWNESFRFHLEVSNTVVSRTDLVGLKYPLKSGGIKGYFVPKLVPKSKSLLPYIIGKDVTDEKLYLWLCQS